MSTTYTGTDSNPDINPDSNPNPNSNSIDLSLDAVEKQLASITLNRHTVQSSDDMAYDDVAEEPDKQLASITLNRYAQSSNVMAVDGDDVVEEQLASNTLNRHAQSADDVVVNVNDVAEEPGVSIRKNDDVAVDGDDVADQPGMMIRENNDVADNGDEVADDVDEVEGECDDVEPGMRIRGSLIGVVWRREGTGEEGESSSPSSGGYVGERGSSEGSTVDDDVDGGGEIREAGVDEGGGSERSTDGVEGGDEVREAAWAPQKRNTDEHGEEHSTGQCDAISVVKKETQSKPLIFQVEGDDDAFASWRKRKKHFFVLSHSGKPIYSRYGDEHKLAGFSATLQAIISFVEDGKDHIQLVRAGKHQVVFLVKGPIYLVCISSTEEPYESLRGQLELIYFQMILILTKSVNRCFEKNPKFDMTPLLGGTDVVFSSLIHSFSWNPATFLHAYTCLPLAYATRQAAGAILQDVADSGVLYAILMCKHKVVSLVGAEKVSLHPDDMLLLSNFVISSESFRTSESFSPICLPRFNSMAFLYAYVHYLDVDTYLMLLTTHSDSFYHLKECRIRIETVLLKSNVLSEVQRSILDGGMRVEDLPMDISSPNGFSSPHLGQPRLSTDSPDRYRDSFSGVGGPAGLWHFIYRSLYLNQYVSSEFSSPINSPRQQKRLYRAYQKLFASMHDKDVGPHKTQFRRDENYVLLCWVTPDFELYAAFDPLADKALAIKTCNRVCQWVKDVENEIFLLGASPFSW